MNGSNSAPKRLPRRTCLAAALLAAASAANAGAGGSLGVMPAGWKPGGGSGVAALFKALHQVTLKPRPAGSVVARLAVTNCADDNGPNTLRAQIAAANDGDTVDLSGLTCSSITLAQGAIPVFLDNLTIEGPGIDALAIDGAGLDRVFVHYGYDTLTLRGLSVRNGVNRVAGFKIAGGACVLSGAYVTLDHASVRNCISVGEGAYGGGILAGGVTLYTSVLADNAAQGSLLNTLTASYGGGAFAYRGTAALYDSSVTGNRAVPDPASVSGSYDTGAGIFADNGGYSSRSTIAGNYTDGTGGGIASHYGFFISDSTISGNTAKFKSGGGVFARVPGGMTVLNSTIAFNHAAIGAGIYVAGTPRAFALQSTIVAGNTASDIGAQAPLDISGASNLVAAAGAGVTLPPDTLSGDPKLMPLAENGGPTPTHALAADSPAIDSGNNIAAFATDQRGPGFARDIGAAPDIGAFESRPLAASPVPISSPRWLAVLLSLLGWFACRRLGSFRSCPGGR